MRPGTGGRRRHMILDGHNQIGVDLLSYYRGAHPYSQDLPALVQGGAALDVDAWIAFPMLSVLNLGGAASVGERHDGALPEGLARVPCAFENWRLLREWAQLPAETRRFVLPFLAMDPSREVEAQVKELWRLRGDHRFYGLVFVAGADGDVRSLIRQGRGLLELAAQWDIPILFRPDPLSAHGNEAEFSDLLWIAEGHSEVRFSVGGACGLHRDFLDRVQQLPNTWVDCSAVVGLCAAAQGQSSWIAPGERRFSADYNDPASALECLAAAYPEKLIWGSNSPFYSGAGVADVGVVRSTCGYEREVAVLKAQAPDTIARIAHRNTLTLLGMPDEHALFAG